jgi:hypothetical protein
LARVCGAGAHLKLKRAIRPSDRAALLLHTKQEAQKLQQNARIAAAALISFARSLLSLFAALLHYMSGLQYTSARKEAEESSCANAERPSAGDK